MSSTSSLPASVRGGRCGLTRSELDAHLWVTEEGRCKALCEDGSKCGDPYAKHAAGDWVRDLTREGVEANPGPCNGGTDAIDGKCPENCAVFVPNEEKKNSCDYCKHHKACHTDVAGSINGWLPRLVGVELNPGPCQGTVGEGKCDQGCTLTPKEVKGFKPDGICDCGHSYLRHGVLTAQSTAAFASSSHIQTPQQPNEDEKSGSGSKRPFSAVELDESVAKVAKIIKGDLDDMKRILQSLEKKSFNPSMSPVQEGIIILSRQHVRIPAGSEHLPSVLSITEQAVINGMSYESVLVATLTPKLAPILNTHTRILVNSENHKWLPCLDIIPHINRNTNITPSPPTTTTTPTTPPNATTTTTASTEQKSAIACSSAQYRSGSVHDEKPDLWLGPSFILERKGNPLITDGSSLATQETNKHRASLSKHEKDCYVQGIPHDKYLHWYDCISVIAAKLDMTNQAVGELKNYLTKLSDPRVMDGDKPIFAETCRGMLITKKQFLLLECKGDTVTQSCIGEWTQPGSAQFIQEWFYPRNPWLLGLQHVLDNLSSQGFSDIDIIKPLGRGAFGRVLQCKYKYQNNQHTSAFKLIITKDEHQCAQFTNEFNTIHTFITRSYQYEGSKSSDSSSSEASSSSSSSSSSSTTTTSSSPTTTSTVSYISPLGCLLPRRVSWLYISCMQSVSFSAHGYYYGCYMVEPVGVPWDYSKFQSSLQFSQSSLFTSICKSLQSLHYHGIVHGDARLPNIITRPNTAWCCCSRQCSYIWIDFRNSGMSDYSGDKLWAYRSDLRSLLLSMGFSEYEPAVKSIITNYHPHSYNDQTWITFYNNNKHTRIKY